VYQSTTTQPPTTLSGLSCGSAHTFEVDAFDAAGNASNRASVIGSTLACPDTQAPSAPTGVVASSRTATSIALIWNASTDNVGVVGYGLYRAYSATSSSSSTTGIFSGLTCNTNYTLAVDAYDAAGNRSNLTTVMVATTACPDTTPPSAPTGLAASSVTQTGLALAWNASSDNVGVTSYDVYRNGTKVATATSNSSSQTGLTCGTSYTFGVVARDAAGNSSATASLNVSTAACPAPTWTSSIADGDTVTAGTTWTVTVNPTPDSVEFWATPVGGANTKLKTDTSAPYDAVLNLASGNYMLGVCSVRGTARTCFDDRKSVTIAATSSSSALSGSAPYSVENFNLIYPQLWGSIQTTAGSVAPAAAGQAQDASGRLSFGAAPDGNGRAARFEIRDSDPGWPNDPTVDRTQLAASTQATWNKSAVAVGDIRWFDVEFYLPNDFDFARNPGWNSYVGLHPGSATGWGCFNISIDYQSDPAYMTFKVAGGSPVGTTANLKYINLFQVTNADRTPYAPNRNRRIRVVYGARFAPDNTGWLEIWVDGVNILPRTNRPTMWAGDTGSYFKIGPYKNKADHFPSGKSVLYITKLAISNDKPPT
jgi:chitodextrinase